MQIGIGLEPELGLSFDEQRTLIREAIDLGYDAGWSPSRLAPDPFQICTAWSQAATAAGRRAAVVEASAAKTWMMGKAATSALRVGVVGVSPSPGATACLGTAGAWASAPARLGVMIRGVAPAGAGWMAGVATLSIPQRDRDAGVTGDERRAARQPCRAPRAL